MRTYSLSALLENTPPPRATPSSRKQAPERSHSRAWRCGSRTDRIYAAHAYPLFIGALIASIPFSAADGVDSPRERRNAEILRVLVNCLENIVKEVGFFGDVARKWGMNLDEWSQRKATKDYTAEMSRISTMGSLEEGLVFLWAMEKVCV